METIARAGLRELSLSVHTVVSNDDLLYEILLRLPVISLVLFKSVSKRWLSLIKSPTFIKRRRQIPNIDPPSGLFIKRDSKTNVYGFAPLDIRIRPRLENTFKTEYANATVLQSCNGLFLCSVRPGFVFCVYNPTLNLFKVLPEPYYYNCNLHNFTSMNFDPIKSPHYKVVHATPIPGHDSRHPAESFRIQTYSSETGIWSLVCSCSDPLPIPYRHLFVGIYWNDAIHWITRVKDTCLHYKLDFVNKTVVPAKILLPVTMCNRYCKFFESRGCLLLLGRDKTHPQHQLNIYAMRNGHTAWTFKYCVNHLRIYPNGVLCIALGKREEDSFMVIKLDGKVVLYKFMLKTFCELPELESMLSKSEYSSSTGIFLFTASFASM